MIVFLSNADTDLLALAAAVRELPLEMPPVRAIRATTISPPCVPTVPSTLPTSTRADTPAECPVAGSAGLTTLLPPATQLVVARLLGGRLAFPAFDALAAECRSRRITLIALPGDGLADADLAGACTASAQMVDRARAYLVAGGPANMRALMLYLAGIPASDPVPIADQGLYQPKSLLSALPGPYGTTAPRKRIDSQRASPDLSPPAQPALELPPLQRVEPRPGDEAPVAAVLFYRSHYLAGNTDFIDVFAGALSAAGVRPLPIYCQNLRGASLARLMDAYLAPGGVCAVDCVISTLSFAAGTIVTDESARPSRPAPEGAAHSVDALLDRLDVPVLQAVVATTSRAEWEASSQGLSPVDVAMSVVLPEVDGRVITTAISFKEATVQDPLLGVSLQRYVPDIDRCAHVAAQAAALIRLRHTPNADKRVAILFNNTPSSNGRIGNGVGLDTGASAIAILRLLAGAGYDLGDPTALPTDGDTLIHRLIAGGTWDTAFAPPSRSPSLEHPGLRFGNVFVGIQPPRGYGADPAAVYHDPELAPPEAYVAYYRWLREDASRGGFGAHSIVHLGKHGTLEWLPGKAVGLSAGCFPEGVLGTVPHFYPFVVNNPGEGAQAKRRSHAVIVDHLPPPLAQAGATAGLEALEPLLAEHSTAATLDRRSLDPLHRRLWEALRATRLHEDLGLADAMPAAEAWPAVIARVEAYLADVEGAQIRNGLHVLGHVPEGEALVDLLFAFCRVGGAGRPSLRSAVAATLGLDPERLPAARVRVDEATHGLLTRLAETAFDPSKVEAVVDALVLWPRGVAAPAARDQVVRALRAAATDCWPALARAEDELTHLRRGLQGGYVPAGPAGAPSRGMLHCLPTGRNFYSVDPRRLPSAVAWETGSALAATLLERYRQDEGRWPQVVGLVLWGTANMRTQGEDVAEALALLGVRPRWQDSRVIGLELISLETLGRPRVDVVLRISGFFRDAFPTLVELLDDAITLASSADEPDAWNYPAAHDRSSGAGERSGHLAGAAPAPRIFGSKPGAYGAGLLPLIQHGNWQTGADLTAVYETWGAYAYGRGRHGEIDRAAFRRRFATIEAAAKNQDNREHDIFDSDDYFQYHGGMVAAARHLREANGERQEVGGTEPAQDGAAHVVAWFPQSAEPPGRLRAYVGDSSEPERVRQRSLDEEARRVFRSRVTNPRWITAAMRHGYRGAAEMASTVEYFFGYDVTARTGAGWMYERLAGAYVLDPNVRRFFVEKNPWALRETCERLLEAAQRGLWDAPDDEVLDQVQEAYLQVESDLEEGPRMMEHDGRRRT